MRLRSWTRPLALAAAPVLLVQARQLKRRIPILPEAQGPVTGRVQLNAPHPPDPVPPRSLLVFGESTAAGVGVDRHDAGMAGALARQMAQDGSTVSWSVTARTGYTSALARTRLLPQVQGSYNDVVVLLGVNDTLSLTRPVLWYRDITFIIERLRAQLNPGGRIVLAGVPRISGFRALPQPMRAIMGLHARSLDEVLREIADPGENVCHVSAPPVTSRHFLAADGFHPSRAGYREWAKQVAVGLAASAGRG